MMRVEVETDEIPSYAGTPDYTEYNFQFQQTLSDAVTPNLKKKY